MIGFKRSQSLPGYYPLANYGSRESSQSNRDYLNDFFAWVGTDHRVLPNGRPLTSNCTQLSYSIGGVFLAALSTAVCGELGREFGVRWGSLWAGYFLFTAFAAVFGLAGPAWWDRGMDFGEGLTPEWK